METVIGRQAEDALAARVRVRVERVAAERIRCGQHLLELTDTFPPSLIVLVVKQLWPEIFDPQRSDSFPARAHDPSTSQLAAVRHAKRDVSKFRYRSTAARVLFVLANRDMTALDAAREASGKNTPISTETARKRVSELAQAGFIHNSGRRERSAGSPDEAIVWRCSGSGRVAVDLLRQTGWSK